MFTPLPPMDAAQSSYSTARKSDCHAAAMIFYYAEEDVSRG
jgi:hypothetical protein